MGCGATKPVEYDSPSKKDNPRIVPIGSGN